MKSSAEVLIGARHVLLDFDGPVCSVFGGATSDRAVADLLRGVLDKKVAPLPECILSTTDPFDVLRYAASLTPNQADQVERRLGELEIKAIATAPSTAGSREAIAAIQESGRSLTIVSNNSAEAITAYLHLTGLAPYITSTIGRISSAPDLLKPAPYLLFQAIQARCAEPRDCVLIGDSVSDLQAADAAGVAVIAYANKPKKRETFEALHPDAIIFSMAELVCAV